MYIKREIEEIIKSYLFKRNVIIIYGARQVGKTTLVKKILENFTNIPTKYFNSDEADIQRLFFEADTSKKLKDIIGEANLVVIDEAQRIKNIGLKLKLLIDSFPNQQVIATGSSSFELANEISEPLTGRSLEFWLYPFSLSEIFPTKDKLELERSLEELLIYGCYPAVFSSASLENKKVEVEKIASNYLYKDIFKFGNIKNPEIVRKLLEALALQVGNEVSFNELSQLLGINRKTVESYVDILEKAFIVFRLRPFSRNLRKELGKMRKIYFYDLGVRNSLINNQNPFSLRNDIGVLWENFVISERMKKQNFIGKKQNLYFWMTYDQQEIDLIEEKEGTLFAYEIKWKKPKTKPPKSWRETYKDSKWTSITPLNYTQFLL